MDFKHLFALSLTLFCGWGARANDDTPVINPVFTYTDSNGTTGEATSYSGSAPFIATFSSGTEHAEGWSSYYEWRFYFSGDSLHYLIRYEEQTSYTFNKAGTNTVQLYAVFTQGGDTISYTADYWKEVTPLTITISESKLEMPNAFSPNNDGKNDIYKAKANYQSIIDFHAYIFNRWGQKLYEWKDIDGGWDGTFHGKPVKQGVYFVLVDAKGADGKNYHIKRDVNLFRDYREGTETTSE